MYFKPEDIYREYTDGVTFKSSLGDKGMYEQSRINERFYTGDQWYGARCGNDRPLVRHNIIKRIGDFKMSQVLSGPIAVRYSADGIAPTDDIGERLRKKLSSDGNFTFTGDTDEGEISAVMTALNGYRKGTAERVGFEGLCGRALKKAYISGSSVLYTYWDPDIKTGTYADGKRHIPIKGDIGCEVLDIENVYFGDPYLEDVESQPYIILASRKSVGEIKREAKRWGADPYEIERIKADRDGKVLLLTRIYKEYGADGNCTVKCVKVTEHTVVRPEFDTKLHMYPIALFRWEERGNLIYGDSEVTYLIPNQIAINRMITAGVWSAMSAGMPIMVVNGDTAPEDITNEPGQIIRVYGSNEDVSGAIRYVTPPDFGSAFDDGVNNLIENTLTQSGANEVALGDSTPDNATALITMRSAATLPLRLIKIRFYDFVERVCRIWADFWLTQYGCRRLRVEDKNGVWYMPFDTSRYAGIELTARIEAAAADEYSGADIIDTLGDLFDRGVIDKRQYVSRLPEGVLPDREGLLKEIKEGNIE